MSGGFAVWRSACPAAALCKTALATGCSEPGGKNEPNAAEVLTKSAGVVAAARLWR